MFCNDTKNDTKMIQKIIKRDGKTVDFEKKKIADAIFKAAKSVEGKDRVLAERLTDKVVEQLEKIFIDKIPTVEDVQDIVEKVLIEEGHAKTAKAYILYRQERRLIREEKKKILEKDNVDDIDKKFDLNALRVLASRYLMRDLEGKIIESPKQLLERVATHVGIVDLLYDERVFSLQHAMNVREIAEEMREVERLKNVYEEYGDKLNIGNYKLNKWHIYFLINAYERLLKEGKMKIGIKKFLEMLQAGGFDEYEKNITEFYEMMVNKDFLPNSPTLMNAGMRLGQLSACFVLPIGDSLKEIMKTSTETALISKSGGGVGINYSSIRPNKDIVSSTSGVASGPASFMEIINVITEVVKQGGKRRGANMAILEISHPDIEDFITIKQKPGKLENFNLSVGIWNDFMNAVKNNQNYALINPRTKQKIKEVPAAKLFNLITFSAWKSAEPGVIFFDNINKYNPLINAKGLIKSTNPCGEQPLYEYESCNLGSINLKRFVIEHDDKNEFDWQKFEKVIRLCTKFLDNVIDINNYPIEEIESNTRLTRKIGLGIMGLYDCLFELEIPYNSEEGFEFMNRVAETLCYVSIDESCEIAKKRGAFPLFKESEYVKGKLPIAGYYEIPKEYHNYAWDGLIEKIKRYGIRNSATTTIAPTGTISMIANCGNGIEPIFALAFEKHVTVGKFYYVDEIFERKLKALGLYNDNMLEKICKNHGCLLGMDKFDEKTKEIFVTTLSMHWLDHIIAQAIWQKWISASISKTINMPNDATVDDISLAYFIANQLGLKGLTVYRDGSRDRQVYYVAGADSKALGLILKPSNFAIAYLLNSIKDENLKQKILSYFKIQGINVEARVAETSTMSKTNPFSFGKSKSQHNEHSPHHSPHQSSHQDILNVQNIPNTIIPSVMHKSISQKSINQNPSQSNELNDGIKISTNFLINNSNNNHRTNDRTFGFSDNNIERCLLCFGKLVREAGCDKCLECGYSSCVIS